MNVEEFSNEFDTLINAYTSAAELGKLELNEYEKSVFLTKAQEDIVIGLYNGNIKGEAIENSEEIRRYLNNLVKTYSTSDKTIPAYRGLSKNSVFFKAPKDLWFITYEAVDLKDAALGCKSGEDICVTPVTQDDYHRIKDNPFKGANERRVLRLDSGNQTNQIIEIISKYNVDSYLVRYIAKPSPIILINLPDDLTIEGQSNKSECQLVDTLHRTILDRAIQLALSTKSIGASTSK